MKTRLIVLILLFLISPCFSQSVYVLNDRCEKNFYELCDNYFEKFPDISVVHEIRGVALRIELKTDGVCCVTPDIQARLNIVKYFLAKIKNPVIIEVHTKEVPAGLNMKNWEFSTVVANNVSDIFTKGKLQIPIERLHAVGYGEFMPGVNNTSNNGGNYTERIDIIILCSINGE